MTMLVSLFLACAQAASTPVPATPPPPDPWASVRFMVGDWRGESEGESGKGTVSRSYAFVLNGRYLHERNVSDYPAQPKNPKGERHEHWSFFSHDRARKAIVLRQFHQEGFVNQYVAAPEPVPGTLAFVSEAFENLPSGWQARETYRVLSPDEFEETFELAPPGGAFSVYSRSRLRRVTAGSR